MYLIHLRWIGGVDSLHMAMWFNYYYDKRF